MQTSLLAVTWLSSFHFISLRSWHFLLLSVVFTQLSNLVVFERVLPRLFRTSYARHAVNKCIRVHPNQSKRMLTTVILKFKYFETVVLKEWRHESEIFYLIWFFSLADWFTFIINFPSWQWKFSTRSPQVKKLFQKHPWQPKTLSLILCVVRTTCCPYEWVENAFYTRSFLKPITVIAIRAHINV